MKNAKRNETQEREMTVEIDSKDLDKLMVDRRNGLRLGTLRQLCQQFGVSVKTQGRKSILKSRRDALQMTVEKMHFCKMTYSAIS